MHPSASADFKPKVSATNQFNQCTFALRSGQAKRGTAVLFL